MLLPPPTPPAVSKAMNRASHFPPQMQFQLCGCTVCPGRCTFTYSPCDWCYPASGILSVCICKIYNLWRGRGNHRKTGTDRLALPRGTWGKMHGRNTQITGNRPLLPPRTFASNWKMNPIHCADTGQLLHFNWVSNQWETSHRYVCMHMLECVYWLSR